MNDLNKEYPRSVLTMLEDNKLSRLLTDCAHLGSRRSWTKSVAQTMAWTLANMHNKERRKEVSHLGGWIADYMNTELYSRTNRWLKSYRAVGNWTYREVFEEYKAEIKQAQNPGVHSVEDTMSYNLRTRPTATSSSVPRCTCMRGANSENCSA